MPEPPLPFDVRRDGASVMLFGRGHLNLALTLSPDQADALGEHLRAASAAIRQAAASRAAQHGEGELDFAAELGPSDAAP